MRTSAKLSIALLCVFVPVVASAKAKPKPKASADPLTVSDLLNLVQKGINTAKAEIDKYNDVPPLDSVTLVLQTETKSSVTAGVNLWFVKIGGGGSNDVSNQMTYVLKPPKAPPAKNVGDEKLDQQIALALEGAAQGVHDAQKIIPLLLDSLQADFAFTVIKNADGGVQFTLAPWGGSFDAGISKTAVHKITVKFATPAPPQKP
jgi:hypothetical protein